MFGNVFCFYINEWIIISVVAFCIIKCFGGIFAVVSSETLQWGICVRAPRTNTAVASAPIIAALSHSRVLRYSNSLLIVMSLVVFN